MNVSVLMRDLSFLMLSSYIIFIQAAFTEFSGLKAAQGPLFAPKTASFSSQVAAQQSSVSPPAQCFWTPLQ